MTNATTSLPQPSMHVVGSPRRGNAAMHRNEDENSKKNVIPMEESNLHANRHIPNFLRYTSNDDGDPSRNTLQVVRDGRLLTAEELRISDKSSLSLSKPILVVDTPTSIGMKLPSGSKKKGSSSSQKSFTVRDLANIVGQHYPVSVIDVALQEELEGWTMQDLVDYFEDEDRHATGQTASPSNSPQRVGRCRPRRQAAQEACTLVDNQRPKVLNQISMEFSRSPLRQYVSSPQFVRDLDWIDNVWPQELRDQDEYPVVQYYCLTSTGGCYTDFHVDFGGTAVWYHVLNGAKDFILIPPTDENLASYEDWLCRPNQAELFFPDMLSTKAGCVKVRLEASQTLLIPTGWIHAVYTPMDAVVFGGNFLHGLDMSDQLKIYCLETRTRVQDRFRFPHFCPIMYYAGGHYLTQMKSGAICQREMETLPALIDALDAWWKVHSKESLPPSSASSKAGKRKIVVTPATAARWAAANAGAETVEDMIASLRKELDQYIQHGIPPKPLSSSSSSSKKKSITLKLTLKPPSPTRIKATTSTGEGLVPKLKLKLGKQKCLEGNTNNHTDIARDDVDGNVIKGTSNEEFRINIPNSAKYGLPQKRRRAPVREDIDAYADPNDEEWKPKQGKKKRSSAASTFKLATKTTTTTPSTQMPTSQRPVVNKKQQQTRQRMPSTPSRQPKAGKSARQRLMKRFK